MSSRVAVVGVGMIPFTTPRNTEPYHVMAEAAARKALDDAGIEYAQVQQGYVGYVYGDSTSGQAALYGLGQTGIPILNVNNNCSTGSSALFLARQAIETGAADCVMALGFEQMMRGALGSIWTDRPSAFTRFDDSTKALQGWDEQAPMAADADGTIDVAGVQIKVGVNPNLLAAMEQMVPLGRGGTPAEAAGAVYLFCIPESDYVSAQTLVCGGGFSF